MYQSYLSTMKCHLDQAKPDIVSKYIHSFENINTRNSNTSALLKVAQLFKLPIESTLKEKLDECRILKQINDDQKMKEQSQPKGDALKVMQSLDNVKGATDPKFKPLVYLYQNVGVLRTSELVNLYISKGECNKSNYIDLTKKQIIIQDHKTSKSMGPKTISIDDKFVQMLKPKVNQYFITTKDDKPYSDSSGLQKAIKKALGCNPYDYRKANSSLSLSSNDTEKIKQTAYNQGHQVATQLSHYHIYNQ